MDVNLDQKFQQRWEFRRNDDEIDSSSNDSKSKSTDDTATRRLQLVTIMASPEDDDHGNNQRPQEKNQSCTNVKDNFNARNASRKADDAAKTSKVAKGIEPSRKGKAAKGIESSRKGKAAKGIESSRKGKAAKGIKLSRKGKAAAKKINRNPSKANTLHKRKLRSIQDPLLVEELKIFAESMISEIKTARESLLVQMKEEYLNLVAAKKTNCEQRSKLNSERKTKMQHGVAVGQCWESNKAVGDRVVSNQARAKVVPDATERRETLMSSLQKPMELTHDYTQMVPPTYYPLPNVLPPHHLHPGSDLYFKNHLLPGIAANCSASNIDISDSIASLDNHDGVIMYPEHFGYSYPISSRHIGLLGDSRTHIASAVNTGFQVLVPGPTTNSLNVHSSMLLEDILRVNERAGWRRNEGTEM